MPGGNKGPEHLLRQNTSGQAFPQMIFSHWNPVNGSPYEESSQAAAIVLEVRKRKGLKDAMPELGNYFDKV